MHVDVRYLGILGLKHSSKNMTFKLQDGSTVRMLINTMNHGYELITSYNLSNNLLIILNGTEISNLKGLETIIPDGSEVVLLSVAHGG